VPFAMFVIILSACELAYVELWHAFEPWTKIEIC
jgi:hypothetical protein